MPYRSIDLNSTFLSEAAHVAQASQTSFPTTENDHRSIVQHWHRASYRTISGRTFSNRASYVEPQLGILYRARGQLRFSLEKVHRVLGALNCSVLGTIRIISVRENFLGWVSHRTSRLANRYRWDASSFATELREYLIVRCNENIGGPKAKLHFRATSMGPVIL